MPDVISGLRQGIQDLMVPELKSHSAKFGSVQKQLHTVQKRIESLQKHGEMQYDLVLKTMDAFRAEMRSQFASLRMSNQLEVLRQVSPLCERRGVVESQLDRR